MPRPPSSYGGEDSTAVLVLLRSGRTAADIAGATPDPDLLSVQSAAFTRDGRRTFELHDVWAPGGSATERRTERSARTAAKRRTVRHPVPLPRSCSSIAVRPDSRGLLVERLQEQAA